MKNVHTGGFGRANGSTGWKNGLVWVDLVGCGSEKCHPTMTETDRTDIHESKGIILLIYRKVMFAFSVRICRRPKKSLWFQPLNWISYYHWHTAFYTFHLININFLSFLSCHYQKSIVFTLLFYTLRLKISPSWSNFCPFSAFTFLLIFLSEKLHLHSALIFFLEVQNHVNV